MPDTPEARLERLGIVLPEQLPVLATYRLATRHRDIVYLAGHVSATLDRSAPLRAQRPPVTLPPVRAHGHSYPSCSWRPDP